MPRFPAAGHAPMRLVLALLVVVVLGPAFGCTPKLKTGSALRMKDRLDPACVTATLKAADGVHDVLGQDPIHFRLTPEGGSEPLEFELRQVEVGLGDAWILEIAGEQPMPESNEVRFAADLEAQLVKLQNRIAAACNAVVLQPGT